MILPPVSVGVPSAVVSAIPKIAVTAEDVEAKCTCSVCMAEKTEEDIGTEVYQLKCGHKFHQNCLVPWMKDHDSCPNCRKKIE
jgi:E3 ubiquitin-protein ligase RNF115/126